MSSRATDRPYSKTIVVKPDSSYERDLFLGIGMPMLSNIDVKIDTRLNRIELQIIGEYHEVDNLISKLHNLEHDIYNALNPDRDGFYYYHNRILTKLFTPPVNLDLLVSALRVYGYESSTFENELKTEAPIEEFEQIHQQVVDLRRQILDDLNRDIERFVITVAIRTDTDQVDTIIGTAIDLELLQYTDYGLQFAAEPEQAQNQLIEHLGEVISEPVEVDEEDMDNISMEDLLFDGGKVVFMRDGKELDESEL